MGAKLFRELCLAESENNVFMSPLSIAIAMAMAAFGATEASQTQKELQAFLEHDKVGGEAEVEQGMSKLLSATTDDEKVTLAIANSIWVNQEVMKSYAETMASAFEAEANTLTTADAINNWVNEKTNGTIPKIIDSVKGVIAVLVNAVYFKASWQNKFDPKQTNPADFTQLDGSKVKCKMMFQKYKKIPYTEKDGVQVVELPYGAGDYAARVFLPRKEGARELARAIERLQDPQWVQSRDLRAKSVHVWLPRFKVEYAIDLVPAMRALKLNVPFTGAASFDRIVPDGHATISQVLHRAMLEVDEEGTVAAAVTAVTMSRSAGPGSVTELRCNRPFLFAIVDTRSGATLFLGRIAAPKFD